MSRSIFAHYSLSLYGYSSGTCFKSIIYSSYALSPLNMSWIQMALVFLDNIFRAPLMAPLNILQTLLPSLHSHPHQVTFKFLIDKNRILAFCLQVQVLQSVTTLFPLVTTMPMLVFSLPFISTVLSITRQTDQTHETCQHPSDFSLIWSFLPMYFLGFEGWSNLLIMPELWSTVESECKCENERNVLRASGHVAWSEVQLLHGE